MITVGKSYKLSVVKHVKFGFFLDANELGLILLPKKYAPRELAVNDVIDVFLYLDSDDRPIATTQKPMAQVDEFAYLKVIEKNDVGIFLDWGLDKDLLVPFSEQHRPMEVGHSYLVHLYLDRIDERITASSKIDKFLDDEKPHHYKEKQRVNLIIANSTDLGYKAIVNHTHWGLLYYDDVHQDLSFGQNIQGYIKYLRPDGRIDLSLQSGKETRDNNENLILIKLKNANGYLAVHDKSDPKLISSLFGISKSSFKKTIGRLYKQKAILIEKEGIRLVVE
jgi:predicted RNA-binding protein (virulence factor B family)